MEAFSKCAACDAAGCVFCFDGPNLIIGESCFPMALAAWPCFRVGGVPVSFTSRPTFRMEA